MPYENTKYNKHLTLDDRIEIQACLDHSMTFKDIAKRIGKDQTTVSKEVKKHIRISNQNVSFHKKDTSSELCPSLLKVPFVCNSCHKRRVHCKFQKQLYIAKFAHDEYQTLLCESREGIPLNKSAFYEIDRIVSDGVKNGQHLYHILTSNELGVSKSTLYRHIKRGYLSAAPIDLPRMVKFKQRNQGRACYVPKAVKTGRTYDDFLSCIQENNISSWVEMDTVVGRTGGKVIVTFDFTFCNFMFGILAENKSALEVSEKVLQLKMKLTKENISFGDIFPVLLTDNGGEFSHVEIFENDDHHKKESSLFFCDPYKSSQKPRVEKNHTLFRDIVPKGNSFDDFSQDTVNLIFSHVNSVKRKSLHGKTPFDLFAFTHGHNIAKVLGIESIPAKDVIQSPLLLQKRSKNQPTK